MAKRLIQSLALGLLTVHINVFALGLGEIQLDSALNQPLSAEIELLSTTPETADSIKVALASYETFIRVGIDRPAMLALLRFNVAARGDGYVIKIDSQDPIREPFLDFILEVTWNSGRLMREYTLLLDPPELRRAKPAQIRPPVIQPQKRAEAPEVSVPVRKSAAARAPKPAASITPADKGGISYGPVQDGETLWRIARNMRRGLSVTTQQMIMALLKENPNAFIAGDINRLKRGSILRIYNPDIVGSLSRREAAAEISRRVKPKSAAMRTPTDVDKQMISVDSAEAKRPSLKLVTPDLKTPSEKVGATVAEAGESEALRQELMLALEISEAQRSENRALQDRMGDLQKQLDSLTRLITLKDSDLAQVQQQLALTGDQSQESTREIVAPAEPLAQEEGVIAEAATVTKPKAIEPVVQPPVAPLPVPAAEPVASPDFISMAISNPIFMATGGGALVLLLLLVLLFIKKRSNRLHEPLFRVDTPSMGGPAPSFLSDLAISGLAGEGLASDEGEVDPITEAEVYMAYGRFQQAESLLKAVLESNPERQEIKTKLLELYFTARDKEQFEAIIAQSAEQLQQNEESWKQILRMGSELSPENPLFARTAGIGAGKDGELLDDILDIGIDLDELSAEMESSSEGEFDIDLGLDFSDLDNDIFSTPAEGSEESLETSFDEGESVELGELDLDVDTEGLDTPVEPVESSDESAADIESLVLDELSVGEDEQEVKGEAVTTELSSDKADLTLDELAVSEAEDLSAELDDALASIDDDIGDLAEVAADDNEQDLSGEDTTTLELDDLGEFDFDLESTIDESPDTSGGEVTTTDEPDIADDLEIATDESPDTSGDEVTITDEPDLSDDFEFDFDELVQESHEPPDSQNESGEVIEEAEAAELDILDETPQSDSGVESHDLDDSEFDLLEDDMDTKIDLAKAYIEMGDIDGASNMLNDVIAQGDDNQQQQAQDLLDSI